MPQGVYVFKIVDKAPAKNSDLQEKDIITKLDSQSIENMENLQELLKTYKAGEKVKLTVSRLDGEDYKDVEVEVTLASKEELNAE